MSGDDRGYHRNISPFRAEVFYYGRTVRQDESADADSRVYAGAPLTKDNCVPAAKRVASALGFVLPPQYHGEFKKRVDESAHASDDDERRRMLRAIEN